MGPTNENPQNPTYIKQTGSLPVLRTVKSTVGMTSKTETQLCSQIKSKSSKLTGPTLDFNSERSNRPIFLIGKWTV